ncbi:MAG: alpha/beta hydrolase [Planctomycetes bacterium]|nr:alpha/beta hydrolase [Planctomycetota bacterium]
MLLSEATLPPVLNTAAPLGARLHGIVGQGPFLVLVPGLAQFAASWAPVVEALASTGGVCVLLPDNPGIGRSRHVAVPRTCEEHAALIAQTLDHLGVRGPVHVAGLSLGSMIAVALAAQLGPQAQSLTLMAGSCREGGFWRLNRSAMARIVGRALFGRGGLRSRIPELLSPTHLAAHPHTCDALLHIRRLEGGYARGVLTSQLVAAARFHLQPYLAKLPVRRCVLVGAADRLVDPRHSAFMARMLNTDLVTLPARGHYLAVDGAPQVAEVLWRVMRGAATGPRENS